MAITDQLNRLSNILDKLAGNEPTNASLTIEERLRTICNQLEKIDINPNTEIKQLTIGKTTLTESDLKKIKELIEE